MPSDTRPAPRPAAVAPSAPAPAVHASPAQDGTLVVPVRIPRGATREIVLRIVLQVEE